MREIAAEDYGQDPRTFPRLSAHEPVDLTNCLREPVRTPGQVQPHGVLLVLQAASGQVLAVSANAGALFGQEAADLVGTDGGGLLGEHLSLALAATGQPLDGLSRKPLRGVLPSGASVSVTAHRAQGHVLVELESTAGSEGDDVTVFNEQVRAGVAALQGAVQVDALCEVAATWVRSVTGFDRVWVYRFEPDGHGVIVAEDRRADVEPFLGLHYPETDIPPLARELYLQSWLRLIPDAPADAVALLPAEVADGAPVDMAQVSLRAVSPIHLQYLANMGVRASMSISLVVEGRLWGLISCHHYEGPRLLSFERRAAAEFMGIVCSMQIAARSAQADAQYRLELERYHARLLQRVAESDSIAEGLAGADEDLLAMCGADGAAVVIGSEFHLVGRTPDRTQVEALLEEVARDGRDLFVTDHLAGVLPHFASLAPTASGVLAAAFSRQQGNYLMWFRGEVLRLIEWGDRDRPVRIVPLAEQPLTPRSSFAAWAQTVEQHSTAWREAEIASVRGLRSAIGSLLISRAEQLGRANAELLRVNEELDAFAYIAAHDLKEPLRGIHTYTTFLAEDYTDVLDEPGLQRLESILRLSRRMAALVDSLLDFAQAGRGGLNLSELRVGEVLDEALEQVQVSIQESAATVRFIGDLGTVRADRDRLTEVLVNLISNAVKHRRGPAPVVEVGVTTVRQTARGEMVLKRSVSSESEPRVFFVRDDGPGIPVERQEEIFRVFRRFAAEEVHASPAEGTGVGLSICRRIVQHHGGMIWCESSAGRGTCFYFTLEPG